MRTDTANSSGRTIRSLLNDYFSILRFLKKGFGDKQYIDFFITVKNLLDSEYYDANIRRSGTEKFKQNGRYLLIRVTYKI